MMTMFEGWKERLLEAIDKDGRSGRKLSAKLKMGPNAISELRNTDKSPSFEKVLALIDEVGASRSYVILGLHFTAEDEEVLRLLAQLPKSGREGFLAFLRAQRDPEDAEARKLVG